MNKVDTFVYFIFRKIFDNKNNDKLPLRFSIAFRELLRSIDSDISRRLLRMEGDPDKGEFTKTFIDIDNDSYDKISFIIVNKIKDILPEINDIKSNWISYDDQEIIYNARQRSTMKINRFINEVFKNEYESVKLSEEEKEYNKEHGILTKPQQLEEFVNKFKSLRKPAKFELLKGDDIIDAYNYKSYKNSNGSLGDSCMRHDRCSDYINFYAKNDEKVSLLVLKDREDDTKIIGRALVWKLSVPNNRYFMDRIYTSYEFDVEHFKNYAKENKWLYKYRQNMSENEFIYDTITKEKDYMDLYVYGIMDNNTYPYMDTLKYYDSNSGELTNVEHDYFKKLEDTSGGYEGRNIYSWEELVDMYTDTILDDFQYYAQNYFPGDVWYHIDDDRFVQDYIEREIDYCYEDFEYIINEDYIIKYIKKYVSKEELNKGLKMVLDDDYDIELSSIEDLSNEQIFELVEELDIKYEIAEDYTNNRYSNYSAKDLMEEIYGSSSVRNLDDDVYDNIENYIYMDECAREYARSEDESYLREIYED